MTQETVTTPRAAGAARSRRVRTGVDVQSISRFDAFDAQVADRIRRRVFTAAERDYCDSARDPAQHYAARWAAKEAFVKVVGGMDGFAYADLDVVRGDDGPSFDLAGDADAALRRAVAADQGRVSLDLSLSHDRASDAAVASVVAHGGGTRP